MISPVSQKPSLPNTPRFAGATEIADGAFKAIQATRTREMLVEDVVGFGALRALMDLFRGYFFGTGELNVPAARERAIREVSSVLTDNVSSGVAALGLGALLATRYGKLANTFTAFPAVELTQKISAQSDSPKTFATRLAQKIAGGKSQRAQSQRVQKRIERNVQGALNGKISGQTAATRIAETLGQKSFDVTLDGERFALPDLMADSRELLDGIAQKAVGKNWQQTALEATQKIMRIKRAKLLCLGVGAVGTMTVPFINRWMTRRIDAIDYYPGEIGLRDFKAPALANIAPPSTLSFQWPANVPMPLSFGAAVSLNTRQQKINALFPYVGKQLQNGNPMPLALSLTPLPFALGLFDTVGRRFVNPFKKGFGKFLRNAFDFGKGFPFTTQQQMASLFALLIGARLLGSRSKNEFRERAVDSGLGWAVWILGTPVLKKQVAKTLEKRTGSELLKNVGGKAVLKSRDEIEKLLSGPVREKTLKQFIWLGVGSTLASMVMLGIVEPAIGIWLTKRNGKSD